MARGSKRQRARQAPARGLSFEQVQSDPHFAVAAGDSWRTPQPFYVDEARSFISEAGRAKGGLDVDLVVALRLLKFPFEGRDYQTYRHWYQPLDTHEFFDALAVGAELGEATSARKRLLKRYRTLQKRSDYLGGLKKGLEELLDRPANRRRELLKSALESLGEPPTELSDLTLLAAGFPERPDAVRLGDSGVSTLLAEVGERLQAAQKELRAVVRDGKRERERIEGLDEQLAQPYLVAPFVSPESTVPGMIAAAADLAAAIKDGELVAVYTDYDVDGLTAGEILRRAMLPYDARTIFGYAEAKSGFGGSLAGFIREAADTGATVLVTLDCGSGAVDDIALAQSLGMRVIVVDHHQVGEGNPAEHHLNPNAFDPPTSANTGAMLSWKFAAALQTAFDGKPRPEHFGEPLCLAGMGCIADFGSIILHEHRAFIWNAADKTPIGVRVLAERVEDSVDGIDTPGALVQTQAALNLAKRSTQISTADIAALLAAGSREEAEPVAERIVAEYDAARRARKRISQVALEQALASKRRFDELGEHLARVEKRMGALDAADRSEEADRLAAEHKQLNEEARRVGEEAFRPIAVAVIEEGHGDYIGYTGPVANTVSAQAGKPAFVFIRNGDDVKFSGRNQSSIPVKIGGLIGDVAMQEACTLTMTDDEGELSDQVNLGGHEEVVSGRCRPENIPAVIEAIENWMLRQGDLVAKTSRHSVPFVEALEVSPERLKRIEEEARRLGPFRADSTPVVFRPGDDSVRTTWNSPLRVGVVGSLEDITPDPANDKYQRGTLRLRDGSTRPVVLPRESDEFVLPEGEARWMLRVGKPGSAYFVREYIVLEQSATAEAA